ncbi:hypothetical protein Y032_0024g1027 [Ancylostoma ceylanicum]|uniref:Uncharacterized protein n=1 Tax=Ancylostoma ceylanicum TaxID=53326 RepID=A0A016UWF1_9BILA|nr:hypothetical protein Y032_0024g1027 [Ancylostoma ceylanicum]
MFAPRGKEREDGGDLNGMVRNLHLVALLERLKSPFLEFTRVSWHAQDQGSHPPLATNRLGSVLSVDSHSYESRYVRCSREKDEQFQTFCSVVAEKVTTKPGERCLNDFEPHLKVRPLYLFYPKT